MKPESHALMIDGKWVRPSGGSSIPLIDPCNGEAFAHIAAGGAGDVDRAVRAAQGTLDGAWGRMPAAERGGIGRAGGDRPWARDHEGWLAMEASADLAGQRPAVSA